jgi:hypothetical protein
VSEVSDFGGGTQDTHRDSKFNDAPSVEKSGSFFAAFPSGGGALETAKADLETQFPNAAAPRSSESTAELEKGVTIDLGRDLT